MNIFILNVDPVKAAQEHCDKHVVKMIVESGQMLSTAHRILDGSKVKQRSSSGKTMQTQWVLSDGREEVLYKAVHTGHPCTVWSMKSSENYDWHRRFFVALCDEYTFRYGKIHLTDQLLREELKTLPNHIKIGPKTNFPQAMPEEFKGNDPVEAYQKFYHTKPFEMVWTKRGAPKWWKNSNGIAFKL